jgi:mRNA-degrading endonuclease RelE of RelBE toxin-antitoxin system
MRFIETRVFTAALRRHLPDEEYRSLQLALALRPDQGKLIPQGGGLRKLRWKGMGRGKRGGLRVIYYWAVNEYACYMLYLYGKNEQGDLTQKQISILARLVREELK